jgi:hypothetical protein
MDTSRLRKPFLDTVGQDMAERLPLRRRVQLSLPSRQGRLRGSLQEPRSCCSTAVFFGVYAVVDYAVVSARRKKEPVLDRPVVSARRKKEPVLDCAVTMGGAAGITTLHKGLRYAGKHALLGAAFGGAASGGIS